MKSKFKDYLLYSLACIGVVWLFISATAEPEAPPIPAVVANYHAVATDKYVVIYDTHTGRSNTFTLNENTGNKRFLKWWKNINLYKFP